MHSLWKCCGSTLVVALSLVSVSMPVMAKDVVVDGVNWSHGMITSVGWGAPPQRIHNPAQGRILACRAAVLDAQRNLLERTKGVRIDSVTLVHDAMVQSDVVRNAVSGVIRGVHPRKQTLLADGSCRVEAELPISGDLFAAMVPRAQFQGMTDDASLSRGEIPVRAGSLVSWVLSMWVADAVAATVPALQIQSAGQLQLVEQTVELLKSQGSEHALLQLQQAMDDYQRIKGFSGIIIDASQVQGFKLAALPWVRDSEGHKLYPNQSSDYDLVKVKLPVSYDFSIQDAMDNKRVATKPLIVRAVSTYGKRSSDLVLEGDSLHRFIAVMDESHLGQDARIMIVVAE